MYRMSIEMIGGNGRWGFDYMDRAAFDTYQAAYNALRRWRTIVKREKIEADLKIERI